MVRQIKGKKQMKQIFVQDCDRLRGSNDQLITTVIRDCVQNFSVNLRLFFVPLTPIKRKKQTNKETAP